MPGVFTAVGFCGHGMPRCWAAGRFAGSLMAGVSAGVDDGVLGAYSELLAQYHPGRFVQADVAASQEPGPCCTGRLPYF